MNTFTKLLSMFLVVAMCFGLFATCAFADDLLAPASSDAGVGNDMLGSDAGSFAGGDDLLAGFSYAEPQATDYSEEETVDYDVSSFANDNAAAQASNDLAVGNDLAAGNDLASADNRAAADTNDLAAGEDLLSVSMADTFNSGLSVSDTETFDAPPSVTYSKDNPTKVEIGEYDLSYRYFYASSMTSMGTELRIDTDFVVESNNIVLTQSFLNTIGNGTWYFRKVNPNDGSSNVVKSVVVQATSQTGPTAGEKLNLAWPAGHDYNRNNSKMLYVDAGAGVNFATDFSGFAYSPNDVWASPMNRMNYSNDYYFEGNRLYLRESFLKSINDGTYYLWGYKTDAYGNYTTRKILGYFTVSNGKTNALGRLSPDGQVWYSGTDPLTFYCDIFDAAGKDWNYKGYDWDVIVPDIRVSTRSNMNGAVSVRIDQYWDLGYGYFMLGQNFLNSLSPEETYYMQVVDARHPDYLYSNVVSFRVGPTLRAIDTDKHVINSTRSLRFRSSSPVAEVYVGNIQLTDASDYGVSWDGKTVTLSFEFLNKRSAGNTYTVKVRTTDGNWASTTFQVLTTAQGSASPRTGDESNLGLWAAFLLLSGTAVVVLIPKLRKHDI